MGGAAERADDLDAGDEHRDREHERRRVEPEREQHADACVDHRLGQRGRGAHAGGVHHARDQDGAEQHDRDDDRRVRERRDAGRDEHDEPRRDTARDDPRGLLVVDRGEQLGDQEVDPGCGDDR